MPVLRVIEGNAPHPQYTIETDRVVVGRDRHHEIWLDHRKVSRVHAEVVRIGNDYYLVDCNSRNGTRLNGKPVKPGVRYPLRYGDTIEVSDYHFTYSETTSEQASLTVCPGVVVVEDDEDTSSGILTSIPLAEGYPHTVRTTDAERKLTALVRFAGRIQRTDSLEAVLEGVLDGLMQTFTEAERSVIVLRDATGNLVPSAVRQRSSGDGEAVHVSRTVMNHVIDGLQGVITVDAAADPRFAQSRSLQDSAVRSLMGAPLVGRDGNVFGVVILDSTTDEFEHGDLDLLTTVAVQVALSVENSRLHAQAVRQETMRRDVSLAREVQLDLLPSTPPALDGFEFFNFYAPARDVGGDLYDYIPLPDGRLAVVVADVSGKGVAAALVSTILCSEIRAYLGLGIAPEQALTRINANFNERTSERCFVTLVMLVIDPRTGRTSVVNAGHWCPLRRDADGNLREQGRQQVGFPIGAVADYEYEVTDFDIEPGDTLAMFSDGIVEAMNLKQEIYGAERVRGLVAMPTLTATEVGETIVADVTEFVGSARQTDDICVLCLSRSSPTASS